MTQAHLTITLPNGNTSSATVDEVHCYAMPNGLGLGLFLYEYMDSNEIAIHLANGAIRPDGKPVLGGFDFTQIRIEFDVEMQSVDRRSNAIYGKSFDLIDKLDTGVHFFPHGAQTIRRFCPVNGRLATKRTAIDTGPLRSKWPTLPTSPGYYSRRAARLRAAIITGGADKSLDLWRQRIGLFHTPGDPEAGAPAGEGIYFHHGYESDANAAWIHRQMMDLTIDRQRTACFDAVTGAQVTAEDWIDMRGSVPQYVVSQPSLPDPTLGSTSPEYGALTHSWTSYDDEHYVRSYGHAIAAWAQHRDPVAKMLIGQLAHHARGVRCEIGSNPRSLAVKLVQAMKAPGTASANMGRADGWALYCMVAAMWTGDKSFRRCVETFVELYEVSAMSNGFAGRNTRSGSSGGITSPWDRGLWSTAFDHVQQFEMWILHNAIFAALLWTVDGFGEPRGRLSRLLGLGLPPAAKIMIKATDQLCRNPALGLWPYQYALQSKSPPHYVVVADAHGAAHRTVHLGGAVIEATKPKDAKGDPTHLMDALALAYRMSGDPVYLECIRTQDFGASSLAAKKAGMLSAFVQDASMTDDRYQQNEQGRGWSLEALGVIP